jgi:ferredoxin--NADP+ reductase
VRQVADLAYRDYLSHELPRHEYLGEAIRAKLHYFPAVTREPFTNQGRLTTLLDSGAMALAAGLPALNPEHDRVMICGSPQMLADTRALLDARGFSAAPRIGQAGHYVFERAFVER